MYYILIVLLSLLAGMVIARKNDVFNMFRGADNKIKEKKVLVVFVNVVLMLTFAWSYSKVALASKTFVDVPKGWIFVIAVGILSFLAPDALIKIFNKISDGLVAVLTARGAKGGPPSA